MFNQSVVLMLPPTGTELVVGLIVNKPTKVTLSKLFPDNAGLKRRTETAFFGGPVDISTPLVLARTTRAPAGAVALFKDVYLNLEARSVLDLLKGSPSTQTMRLYLPGVPNGPTISFTTRCWKTPGITSPPIHSTFSAPTRGPSGEPWWRAPRRSKPPRRARAKAAARRCCCA